MCWFSITEMIKRKSGFPESVCQLRPCFIPPSSQAARSAPKAAWKSSHSTPLSFPEDGGSFHSSAHSFRHSRDLPWRSTPQGKELGKRRASMDSVTCSSWGFGHKGNLKITQNELATTELGFISVNKTAQHWVNVSYSHV